MMAAVNGGCERAVLHWGRSMTVIRFAAALLAATLAAPAPAQPQEPSTHLSTAEVERVRTEKKAWIALNMELTPTEAEAFWPLYESFQKDVQDINRRLFALVEVYAEHYRNNTLTDEGARKLMEEALAVDERELKLRRAYSAKLAKVIPARKALRYLQLESRIHTQIRYELAANLPLAGDFKVGAPQ